MKFTYCTKSTTPTLLNLYNLFWGRKIQFPFLSKKRLIRSVGIAKDKEKHEKAVWKRFYWFLWSDRFRLAGNICRPEIPLAKGSCFSVADPVCTSFDAASQFDSATLRSGWHDGKIPPPTEPNRSVEKKYNEWRWAILESPLHGLRNKPKKFSKPR